MAAQTHNQVQTQDIIRQLSDMFSPRLKEIQDKLESLVTRREHEKDLSEIASDIAAQRRDFDRLQQWADQRPRKSADADWVHRLEADIHALRNRPAQAEQMTNRWLMLAIGCVGAVIAGTSLLCGGGSLLLGVAGIIVQLAK